MRRKGRGVRIFRGLCVLGGMTGRSCIIIIIPPCRARPSVSAPGKKGHKHYHGSLTARRHKAILRKLWR